MVHSPRLRQRRVSSLSSGLDIAPTLVNLSGGALPASFEGHSLVGALLGQRNGLPKTRFAQFYVSEDILRGKHPLRMVSARTERYNMVLDRRSGSLQAWNWRHDPSERQNLWPADADARKLRSTENAGEADIASLSLLKQQLDRFVSDSTHHVE
jgi:arylsulfatase A-like enzyme